VTAQTEDPEATAGAIVERVLQQDALRRAQLNGYTATPHYIAVNKQRRAEMLVTITCTTNNGKTFTILSEEGSSAIRKHVFYKMLQEEIEASRRDTSGIGIRLASQSMGYLTFLGAVLSEPLKIKLLRAPTESTIKVTFLDSGVYWFTSVLV
jgi:hypothetical protein